MPSGQIVQFRPTIGYAFEQITVSTTEKTLTASKYKESSTIGGAHCALVTNSGASIRYTYDGTTPTSTVGHLLPDGGNIVLTGQNQMASFQAIRAGSTDSVITITYERE